MFLNLPQLLKYLYWWQPSLSLKYKGLRKAAVFTFCWKNILQFCFSASLISCVSFYVFYKSFIIRITNCYTVKASVSEFFASTKPIQIKQKKGFLENFTSLLSLNIIPSQLSVITVILFWEALGHFPWLILLFLVCMALTDVHLPLQQTF